MEALFRETGSAPTATNRNLLWLHRVRRPMMVGECKRSEEPDETRQRFSGNDDLSMARLR